MRRLLRVHTAFSWSRALIFDYWKSMLVIEELTD